MHYSFGNVIIFPNLNQTENYIYLGIKFLLSTRKDPSPKMDLIRDLALAEL